MRLLIVLLLLAGCGRTETPQAEAPRGKVSPEVADQGPRLVGNPPTVQIELPPRMTRALAEKDTSFTTLTPFEFVHEISPGSTVKGAWAYPYDGRQAPFAVIGDFDGDERDDVALLQRSASRGRVAVIFDRSYGPLVVIVKSWSRMTAGDAGKSGFYLARFPAGTLKVPDFAGTGDTSTTVTLLHEGIEVSNYGKAAMTFWWNRVAFESVTTAD